MFHHCHTAGFSEPQRLEWPDGQSLLEQPALAVQMFGVIRDEIVKESASNAAK